MQVKQLLPPHKNIISIPRSGQHFIEKSLRTYHILLNKDFHYCEFYSCCQKRPCKKNKDAIQKHHDIYNKVELNENERYLFLYRKDIIQQAEAVYRLNKYYKEEGKVKIDYTNQTEYNNLVKFIKNYKPYIEKMHNKYINDLPYVLDIDYDNLIINFNENFKQILILFDIEINNEYIEKTKQIVKPHKTIYIDEDTKNKISYLL